MKRIERWIDAGIRRVRDKRRVVAVGPPHDPLMHRYYVIPRNRFLNVYLHCIHRGDVGDLHDHRMANISIVLQGHYQEERFVRRPVPYGPMPAVRRFEVKRWRPLFRWASTPHRVVLDGAAVWSLFVGFPHTRNWGFWVERRHVARWIPHERVSFSEPGAA